MRSSWMIGAALALAACAASEAQAEEPSGPAAAGRARYLALCASCHGSEGAGDGPVAASLRVPPPDLRRIAERHGRFDRRAIAATIDGRDRAGGHGSDEMPVWGSKGLRARKGDVGPSPAMLDVLAYLESIQIRP